MLSLRVNVAWLVWTHWHGQKRPHLLKGVVAVLGTDVAGAVAAPLGVEGLPKVRQ